MLGDWQLFWHEHEKRPALITSVTWGEGYTESLGDDGQIVKHHNDIEAHKKIIKDMVADLRAYRSSALMSFRK